MSLEARRERADLLEVFKILNKFEGVQEEDFFVSVSLVAPHRCERHLFLLLVARVALLLRFVYRDRTAHAQVRAFTFAFAFDEEIPRKSVYRFNLIHFQS
jgi:hypothetical protein